jgi:hypothetical protein
VSRPDISVINQGLNEAGRLGLKLQSITINLLRPDDLLCLTAETQNLRLDTSNPQKPMLVVDQASAPAYLIFTFPPQNIAEEAYFEEAPNYPQEPGFNSLPPQTPSLPSGSTPLNPPGQVPVRMAGVSRLVFQLPKALTSIPYQTAALLDWTKLNLVVSPTALGTPAPTLPQPGPLQTALELPYRLILSPGSGVTWLNAFTPVTYAGRSELWHTRLAKIIRKTGKGGVKTTFQEASLTQTIPVRAIWSPDFVQNGNLPLHSTDSEPFPADLSVRDRAQIVILTSGTEGYIPQTGSKPWAPTPIQASRLFLSALGGWLSSDGRWPILPKYNYILFRPLAKTGRPLAAKAAKAQIATIPKPGSISVAPSIPRLPEGTALLDLGEWSHLATQGRDHYVRVVYEGYLYPFGHRASLVKVTERKFVAPEDPDAPSGPYSVTAYLRQHMYIVVRQPQLSYPTGTYTYQGREMPFYSSIRITTAVTPDIDSPTGKYIPPNQNSFWVQVQGANFQFHLTATDRAGATFDFLAPLIFVSVSETDIDAVQQAYLTSGLGPPCVVKGKKIAYADPSAGDTTLKTTTLYFDTQVLADASSGGPAPFLPILSQAAVSVPSLEELLGVSSPVNIAYYNKYLSNGLDTNAGVFATLVGTGPNVGFTADKAGGFATPSLVMTALSARKGLVAGSPDNAAQGLIDPAQFFGGVQVEAMLFGTIPLGNLIPLISGSTTASAAQNAPEIRTHAVPNARNPTQLITRINWVPQLKDYNVGPVKIAFNSSGQNSKLSLQATITRMLNGSPPQSLVKGELSNFALQLLGVVELKIISITFSSANGSKTNVAAKLNPSNAIGFIGPLSFLQDLANILPPGIFGGEGPSIDLTSTEIKISYTLGLPSLSIGVFSLENIAVTTGIDLPYLNGQPAFEFAFCSRSSPFLLTVECLGGGGFVHLIVNTSGVQLVEGALEFGGEFSLDLGVASGGVHIMAGIYFKLAGSSTTLTGFVDIGGEVSVMGIISISIDLNLSLSWIHTSSGNKIQGRATLSISVSVLFFSISVSVSVERSFGSGGGDPRVAQVISADDWAAYALAFAG